MTPRSTTREVVWSTLSTTWGPFAVGDDGEALVGLQFPPGLEASGSPRRRPLAAALGRELREYLAGKRTAFRTPIRLEGSPFQMAVWHALGTVPYGEVITYAELARRLGRPQAARAVGQALGANPIPIVVPCHRVVGSDSSLGGYGPGLVWKRRLLELESRTVAQRKNAPPSQPHGATWI